MRQADLPGVELVRAKPRPAGWEPDALEPVPDCVRELALDFETTGLRWWAGDVPVGIGVAYRLPDGKLVSRYFPTRAADGNLPEPAVQAWTADAVRGRKVLGLNVRFDAHMSRAPGWTDWRTLASSLGDVGHYAALIDDHRRKFSLDDLGRDLLGEGKVEGLDLSNGAQIYPAWMIETYGRQDVALVIRLMEHERPLLAAEGLQFVAALEDRVIPATVEMEANGFPIDVEKLDSWLHDTQRAARSLELKLADVAGRHVNVNSGSDLVRLFESRGLESDARTEPTERYPEGQPSFTDAVVARFASRDPVIALARELSHLLDLRSKFLIPYRQAVGPDGLIRYGLNQLRSDDGGTVSGRYSSSAMIRGDKASGINVQQVMAVSKQRRLHGERYLVRELFTSAPGKLLLAADAKQIEFRVLVHMSKSERLIDAYRRDPNTDFHVMVGDFVHAVRPDFDRKRVKNVNFEQAFGGGLSKTAEMLGCSTAEAQAFMRDYDAAFPELRALLRECSDKAKRRGVAEGVGYVRTILGRKCRFVECPTHGWRGAPSVNGKREPCGTCPRLHKALNGAVQGSAADVNKVKLAELYEAREELGLTMRVTNHDEAVGDVQDDHAARRVAALLDRQSLPFRVPILWETKTGRNWAECA